MSLELILIVVLGLLVLALAALVWMLWQRPTPADSSQEVAALKARIAALSTPDLGPLHQMVSRLETELAELKSTPWRGHPARAEVDSVSPDAGGTPAVQDPPLHSGGEGPGVRSGEVPSPDSGEGQGGSADLPSSGNPDAGGTPAVREEDAGRLPPVRLTLDEATRKTEELLNQTDNPTDRAYLTGLHERLVNARQVKDLEEWDKDRTLIFGLYKPVSDIGAHEVSDDLRPAVQELTGVLDEARAEAIDHLRVKFGVEMIAPVTGTHFDPLIHEDAPTTRLTPPSHNLAHTIYARVGLGLRRGEQVIEKAWVKRYAGYEGPTAETTEHRDSEMLPPLPPPYPSPVPGEGNQSPDPQIGAETSDNAAKSLLQQAAEHGN